ncbi:unnamed protein product [Zymoseptoria tritici ST99CH_1A5]|uniref:Fatty acid hydroxylase domain-containing protein n=3 Tax=Zymoseptoria tritici TaxID=1047171 RepID=F9X7I0_ZYMTI|nr:uncharacterized protein MYCGRDRAFT_70541 [Zymoseptoria tritici IPO323]EGP89142.1 hypothetical protein MYCGRDRAFT_70541 [Zymoseptoria tritici IPO323]SMR49260.1 unnamed protein product [Zymoseptoria tritici ST99CH_1E4]SMY23129.1 unnamed protein product [Zymoseptoria tritici ST99CH_1A5]
MAIDRRPQDSMKSTWRGDEKQWGFSHKFLIWLDAFHTVPGQEPPIHAKTDKMPVLSEWSCHVWILLHAIWPMLLQQAYISWTGYDFHPFAVYFLYTMAMQINSIHEVKILRRLGYKYGYLDGDKHARDEVPDVGVNKVFASLQLTTSIRPMMTMLFAYRRRGGMQLSWWLPVELALYSVVLDGFFYAYHRACHELDYLWQYHRTHHLTKHPNPMLSSYADHEQEFLEIALIPFLTWAVLKYAFQLPMGFHDWWICHEYVIFSEAFGHSGLRIYSTTTSAASPFLKAFGCELAVEDHDLHHRRGWKKSSNYGKQTRLWDVLFGTTGQRIEITPETIDHSATFNMPLL